MKVIPLISGEDCGHEGRGQHFGHRPEGPEGRTGDNFNKVFAIDAK
jgi:hypothetical protein